MTLIQTDLLIVESIDLLRVVFFPERLDTALPHLTPPPFFIRRHTLPQTVLPASFLGCTSLSEAHLRPELLAQPCLVHHLIQFIHLLQCQALGLINHQPNKPNADQTTRPPYEEHLGL